MTQITSSNKNSDKFFAATDIISSFLSENLRDHTGLQADFTNCFDCMVRDRPRALAELRLVTYWLQLIFKYFQSFSNYLRDWNITALRFPFQKLVVLSIQSNLNRFIFNHFYNPIYYYCTPMVYNHSVAKKVSPPGSNRLGESWLRSFELNHLNSQHYEYNTPGSTLCTPCSTLYPYPDVGGTVMQDSTTHTPQGREGYIYLVWAEGTNRYLIAGSVDPAAQIKEWGDEGPFKLTLLHQIKTRDMAAAERHYHSLFSQYRVYLKWFELPAMAVDYIGSTEVL